VKQKARADKVVMVTVKQLLRWPTQQGFTQLVLVPRRTGDNYTYAASAVQGSV
jgi:hypothetical protein